MLSSMLNVMADHGKVIVCGATATYNKWGSKMGASNFENVINKRIEMKGILYYYENFAEQVNTFMDMVSLDIKGYETMITGIENLPITYRKMIEG